MTTTSRFLPQTTGAGSVSEPKIVAVDTTACPSTLFVSRSIRCVSDHMVIANAQHLTFRYSQFPYYIPLTALTTVPSRLQHTLVDIHTFTLISHVDPLDSMTPEPEMEIQWRCERNVCRGGSNSQDSYCSLIREYSIITKEYNKNINNLLGVGVVIRGCPQDSNTKVCSTHIALFATRERSKRATARHTLTHHHIPKHTEEKI